MHVLNHRCSGSARRGVRHELRVIVLNVESLPLLLAESLRVARTIDNRAEQVEALTALGLATPVLAECSTTAIFASILVPTVLANPFATALLALVLLFAVRAESLTTAIPALVLLFSMRADRGAAALNTSLAPLQMHTLDNRHSGTRADFKEREIDKHSAPLFEPTSLARIEVTRT